MITYKELFEGLKRSGLDGQRKLLVIDPKHRVRATQMIQILCHAEIAVWDKDTRLFHLHPKQVKPSIIVVDIPKAPVPSAVHVNWSRGHSGASYPVLAHGISQIAKHEGERYYVVNISTDPSKVFPKHVWEADCKAAVVAKVETVAEVKAA